jgi:hypothetical protein
LCGVLAMGLCEVGVFELGVPSEVVSLSSVGVLFCRSCFLGDVSGGYSFLVGGVGRGSGFGRDEARERSSLFLFFLAWGDEGSGVSRVRVSDGVRLERALSGRKTSLIWRGSNGGWKGRRGHGRDPLFMRPLPEGRDGRGCGW